MKPWIGLAVLLIAALAQAQVGPTVTERTGELGYHFEFAAPAARGRYQPKISLDYRSDATGDVGYGWGWDLSTSYIESDNLARPTAKSPPTHYFLHNGTSRILLVQVPGTSYYRPEVSSTYLKLWQTGDGWAAVDGNGNRYSYNWNGGAAPNRHYLGTVTDPDNNVTTYSYESIASRDGAPETAIMTGIVFNGTVSKVSLAYRDVALPSRTENGHLDLRGKQLDYVQILNKRESDGVAVAVRTYRIDYSPARNAGHQLLRAVHEFGKSIGLDQRYAGQDGGATLFDYEVPAGSLPSTPITFDAAQQVAYGTIFNDANARPAWIDIDNDGRLDLVWGTRWARNTTIAGAAALSFEAPRVMKGFSPSNGVSFVNPRAKNASYAYDGKEYITEALLDFNGDGFIDFLTGEMNDGRFEMTVRFGRYYEHGTAYATAGDYEFGYPIGVDTSSVWNTYSDNGTRIDPYTGFPAVALGLADTNPTESAQIVDVTGDGLADYILFDHLSNGTPQSRDWTGIWIFKGYMSANGIGFGPAYTVDALGFPYYNEAHDVINYFPGCGPTSYSCDSPVAYGEENTYQQREDFFLDMNGDGVADRVHVLPDKSWSVALSSWFPSDTWYPWATDAFGLSPRYASNFGTTGSYAPPPFDASAVLADLNGDGLADYIRVPYSYFPSDYLGYDGNSPYAYPADMEIMWNTGRGLTPDGAILALSGPLHSRRVPALTDGCGTQQIDLNERGIDAFLADVNGDGIVDYVKGADFLRGHNGYEVGRTILLRKVTTRAGAIFDVVYAPATKFGDDAPGNSSRPVVETLTTSGPGMVAQALQYRYQGPVFRSPWYDARAQFRGFEESWVTDGGTGLRTHFVWNPLSHAFHEYPRRIETEASEGTPAAWHVVKSESREMSARSLVAWGCVSSTDPDQAVDAWATPVPQYPGEDGPDPSPESYPILVFESSSETRTFIGNYSLRSATSTQCSDIDSAGNVRKTFTDPDTQHDGDGYYTIRTFDLAKTCVTCVRTETVQAESSEALLQANYYYDARDRLQHVGRAFEGAINAYNANGTLHSVTDGDTTTTYDYDEDQGLRVTKETVTDGTKSLVTDRDYDPDTGELLLITGPYLSGGALSPHTGFVYDGLGRVVSRTNAAADTTTVNDAVEAYVYTDFNPSTPTAPPSVTTYRFAVAKTYPKAGPIPDDNATIISTSYVDGLRREIQTRKRLGKDSTVAPAAGVVQGLSGGYQVTATIRDAAGRVKYSFDPYYSTTAAYRDLSAPSEPELSTSGLRTTINSWDEQGRPSCSTYQPVSGTLPLQLDCSTNTAEGYSYKLATRYSYGTRFLNSRLYGAVIKVVPENNVNLGVTELFDPLGRSCGRVDDDGNRTMKLLDPLGRESALLRQDSTGHTYVSSTTEYDLDGRLLRRIDPSFGTREYLYDAGGRLETVITDPQAGTLMRKVVNAYTDLNRLTTVTEYSHDGTTQRVTNIASYTYDSPVNTGYLNTGGRVASIANATSTTILGYNAQGVIEQRDQAFVGVAGRFTMTSTHRADALALSESYETVGTTSTEDSTATTISLDYDSAGRQVRRAGRRGTAPDATFWELPIGTTGYGAYDATGRVPRVEADGGLAVTLRGYSPYSGNLSSETKTLDTTSVYSADTFQYQGIRLQGYVDRLTGTTYINSYDVGGRLLRLQSTASKSACDPDRHALAQNGSETISHYLSGQIQAGPSIGNVQWAETIGDSCVGGNVTSTSMVETYGYNPAKLDQLDVLRATTSDSSPAPLDETFTYDEQDHLVSVTRNNGDNEALAYGPDGELVMRRRGASVTMYVGMYATVRGTLPTGCTEPGPSCLVQPLTLKSDVHALVGKTRIASISSTRVLYYYRDRLGSIIATSLGGAMVGDMYRYTLYGRLDKVSHNSAVDLAEAESELGYSGALKLSGGLIYLKARIYDTTSRRFLTADLVDPRRYAYAGGDPVNFVDLLGLEEVPVGTNSDGSTIMYDTNTRENRSDQASYDPSYDLYPFSYDYSTDMAQFKTEQLMFDYSFHHDDLGLDLDMGPTPVNVPVEGPTGVYGIGIGGSLQLVFGLEASGQAVFDKRGNSGIAINISGRGGAALGAEAGPQFYVNPDLPSADMVGGGSMGAGAGWFGVPVSVALDLQSFTPEKNFCGNLPTMAQPALGVSVGIGGKGLSGGVYMSGGYTLYIPMYTHSQFTPFGISLSE